MKAWVDQHLHFGNAVTSRAEGIHAVIKGYLQSSVLNLIEAWSAIKAALENQLAELQANQARQQQRNSIRLSSPLFHPVRGWVSYQALEKVYQQKERLNQLPIPPYTGRFTRTLGLPYAHRLQQL